MKKEILKKLEDMVYNVSKGTFMAWLLAVVFAKIEIVSLSSGLLLWICLWTLIISIAMTNTKGDNDD